MNAVSLEAKRHDWIDTKKVWSVYRSTSALLPVARPGVLEWEVEDEVSQGRGLETGWNILTFWINMVYSSAHCALFSTARRICNV